MYRSTVFIDKIKLILKKLCNDDYYQLTEFFIDKTNIKSKKDTYFFNREKLLRKWINHPIKCSNDFKNNFHKYKISRIKFHNQPLFTLKDFNDIDIESFTIKLNDYIRHRETIKHSFKLDCKYLYFFDDSDNKLYFYEVFYGQNIKENLINIKLKLENKNYSYSGRIEYFHGIIDINVKDIENRKIHFLFNTDLKNSLSTHIYGVSIGISSQNEKFPKAKKVVFSKKIFDEIELEDIYLALNETSTILAGENIFQLNTRDIFENHIHKYKNHLKKYHLFFTNLQNRYKELKKLLYYTLAFKEFKSIYIVFNKLSKGEDFFVNNRVKLFDVFLETMMNTKDISIYIVLPIFNKEDNIFIKQSDQAIKLQDYFINLKVYNIKTEIIFVLKSVEDLNSSFYKIIKKMYDNDTKIKFVLKDNIKKDVTSMDFFYSSKKDFVVTNPLRMDKKAFIISKQIGTIDEYITTYRRIETKSIDYQDFINDNSILYKNNPIITLLKGEWFTYFYTYDTKDNKGKKLWENRMMIYKNNSIEYFSNNKMFKGKLEIYEHQSIIFIKSTRANISVRLINNYDIRNIFVSIMVRKQFMNSRSIATIEIFSKDKLSKEDIDSLIKNNSINLITVNTEIEDKIKSMNIEKYGY